MVRRGVSMHAVLTAAIAGLTVRNGVSSSRRPLADDARALIDSLHQKSLRMYELPAGAPDRALAGELGPW